MVTALRLRWNSSWSHALKRQQEPSPGCSAPTARRLQWQTRLLGPWKSQHVPWRLREERRPVRCRGVRGSPREAAAGAARRLRVGGRGQGPGVGPPGHSSSSSGPSGGREPPPARKRTGAVRPGTRHEGMTKTRTQKRARLCGPRQGLASPPTAGGGHGGDEGPAGVSPRSADAVFGDLGAPLRRRHVWRSGRPALGTSARAIFQRHLLTLSLSHFGNSHDVSDSFIILVFVLVACAQRSLTLRE